jgi:predicted  nucleic acid-binding Zn-ribbon protein
MSDTPRTEAEVNRPHGPLDGVVTVDADFAAQLERELTTAQERIKRLETALRRIANTDYRGNRSTESQIAFEALKP